MLENGTSIEHATVDQLLNELCKRYDAGVVVIATTDAPIPDDEIPENTIHIEYCVSKSRSRPEQIMLVTSMLSEAQYKIVEDLLKRGGER